MSMARRRGSVRLSQNSSCGIWRSSCGFLHGTNPAQIACCAQRGAPRMSIVVFDPDRIDEVDFADRMRHPAAADPAGGMWLSDTEPPYIDANALRQGRLKKLRAWMAEAGYGAVVLLDPYNQRYATGSRNMFGYFLRNSTRYFFIPTQGPIVLFEYPQSY